MRPDTTNDGVYFLSAKDIQSDGVSFDAPLYISEKDAQQFRKRCNPERGDILIVSRGATVGRLCIVKTDKIFCLLGSVILLKIKKVFDSRLITYAIKSPLILNKLINVSGATAQQAIYLRDIKGIKIKMPSNLEFQDKIVSEIETRLSESDHLLQTINQQLIQAESLRQSILQKAFSGKLI